MARINNKSKFLFSKLVFEINLNVCSMIQCIIWNYTNYYDRQNSIRMSKWTENTIFEGNEVNWKTNSEQPHDSTIYLELQMDSELIA